MPVNQVSTIESIAVRPDSSPVVVGLFAATTFTAAGLLFLVQPMAAKLLLPRLGGSPAVWNTCVLFFQTTLLLGYLYAHLSTRWLGVRRQALWHLCLIVAPAAFLPLGIGGEAPTAADNPVIWLLRTLTSRIGLAFFVVSASAPLLQRWFAALPIPSSRDPYFLYAASNLGSMLALVAFPLALEPMLGARYQSWLWTAGYVVLAIGTASCAFVLRSFRSSLEHGAIERVARSDSSAGRKTRWRWILLSFVPSSLMLGVTTHISTDVAAVPLLWIVPLALYLGTFVLAFAPRQAVPQRWLIWVMPGFVSVCLFTIVLNAQQWWLIPLHLATFTVCAMVCHSELAGERPGVQHLTEYYIWMSIGGMLGGVFNTLIAPRLFTQVLEYPLVLALALLIRPTPGLRTGRPTRWSVPVWGAAGMLLLCMSLWAAGLLFPDTPLRDILVGFVLIAGIGYVFLLRPEPFGITALVLVAVIGYGRASREGSVLFAARSFFGVHRVIDSPDHTYHLLQHGSTNHGRENAATMSGCEPQGYFHRSGPIGQVFAEVGHRLNAVAVVGLGSGALACYAEAGQRWTFYEIDPTVERIARDPGFFTYLQHSRVAVAVTLGDGRLSLQRGNDAYDLIALDAFSSDAIPVHLLTKEAFELYLSRLRPGGVITVHISNRYLNLEPVLSAIARDEHLVGLSNFDGGISDADAAQGRWPSFWIVLARTRDSFESLSRRPGWRELIDVGRTSAWADDYSNLVQVLRLQ